MWGPKKGGPDFFKNQVDLISCRKKVPALCSSLRAPAMRSDLKVSLSDPKKTPPHSLLHAQVGVVKSAGLAPPRTQDPHRLV